MTEIYLVLLGVGLIVLAFWIERQEWRKRAAMTPDQRAAYEREQWERHIW